MTGVQTCALPILSNFYMVDKVEFVYPDVDLVHLKDGRVIGISLDCVVLYESRGAFDTCSSNDLPTISLVKPLKITYDFMDGEVVELRDGEVDKTWSIHTIPDDVLRHVLYWNDKDGDFDGLSRLQMLEIFLSDFVINRSKEV